MKKAILFWIIGLVGCEPQDVQIDLPQRDSRLVVGSLFSEQREFSLYLRSTENILEGYKGIVPQAEILLYEDGAIKDTLDYDSGAYRSEVFPQRGRNYAISIDVEEFENVMATSFIPKEPVILSTSKIDSIYTRDEYIVDQFNITIQDNPNEHNFYGMSQEFLVFDEFGQEVDKVRVAYDEVINDPVLQDEGLLDAEPNFLVFDDRHFDGEAYKMQINHLSLWSGFYTRNAGKKIVLITYFRAITEDHYNYLRSLVLHEESKYSDIWEGSGEPVQLFTNIEGGYGIFTGYSQVIDTIVVQ